jgi:hypothetical protein
MEKPMVQMFSWILGVYNSDFLATHEDRGKRGLRQLMPSFIPSSLMVMNDHRSPNRISSVDQYLSLHCYFMILRGSFLFVQGC